MLESISTVKATEFVPIQWSKFQPTIESLEICG